MVGTDGRVKIRAGDGVVDQQCQSAATRAVSSDESVVGKGGGLGAGGQLGLLEGSHQDMMFVEEGLELGGGVYDAIAVKLQDVGGVSGARSGGGRQGRGRCWGGDRARGVSGGGGGVAEQVGQTQPPRRLGTRASPEHLLCTQREHEQQRTETPDHETFLRQTAQGNSGPGLGWTPPMRSRHRRSLREGRSVSAPRRPRRLS